MTPRFNSRSFLYVADTMSFIADASDLVRCGDPLFGRISQDTLDMGLVLISHKTDKASTWYVSETSFTNANNFEGREVHGWYLRPTVETLLMFPDLVGHKMFIAND